MNNSRKTDSEPHLPPIAYLNRLLSRCSLNCLYQLARPLAWLARNTDNQLARVTRRNLELALPELDAQHRHRLACDILSHTADTFIETAYIWHRPIEEVLALADDSEVCDAFLENQNARIIIAPHHGNWEYLNLWLAAQLPLNSLYKPARNSKLDSYIRSSRSRNGAQLLPTDTGGLRGLIRGLKNGKSCMVLPDQRPGKDRGQVEAPFFGRTVETSTLVQQLARRTHCPTYIAAALRDRKRGRFRIVIRPLSENELTREEPYAAACLNRAIENLIRECPEQYQWAYKRFRPEDYSLSEKS